MKSSDVVNGYIEICVGANQLENFTEVVYNALISLTTNTVFHSLILILFSPT